MKIMTMQATKKACIRIFKHCNKECGEHNGIINHSRFVKSFIKLLTILQLFQLLNHKIICLIVFNFLFVVLAFFGSSLRS